MIPKSYNSFEEIDNQLKILSLQKQIYKEHLKLSLKSTKLNLKPATIKNELKGFLQNQLITLVSERVINKLKK
jgi:hypothetical protein